MTMLHKPVALAIVGALRSIRATVGDTASIAVTIDGVEACQHNVHSGIVITGHQRHLLETQESLHHMEEVYK